MTYSNLTSIIKKSPTTYGERDEKLHQIMLSGRMERSDARFLKISQHVHLIHPSMIRERLRLNAHRIINTLIRLMRKYSKRLLI